MAVRYVLDASALLCLINAEPGVDIVRSALADSVIGAVNLSEVVAKIVERGVTALTASAILDPLHLPVVEFDRALAVAAGALRASTRHAGLSFGDRACLALAASRGLVALTGDRAWVNCAVDAEIEVFR